MKDFNQYRSIFMRELFSYFNSPIAYIFIVVFVLLLAGLYMTNFFLIGSVDMRYFFGLLPLVLCVFIPAVTMRIWAEEKKGNTFELLLTFPMESHKLVIGKFAAGLVFYGITLAGTLAIPVMLLLVGRPDIGPIAGGYLGAFFVGAFFLSVGIFISGLCRDQIIAFIVTMLVCFFFYLSGLDFIAGIIDGWIPGAGSFLKANLGMTRHFASFEKGVIDNKDVLYFLVMTAVFLTLNIFSVEDRMRPKAKLFFSGAVGVCIAISVILNFLLGDIPPGRFDMTEGKLYTITKSTGKILRALKAPVTAKLYISPPGKMPTAFKTLEQDIKDRLEELRVLSQGKFDFKVFHMEAVEKQAEGQRETSLEERIQNKGIAPFQVQSIEQDQMGIKVIYSAISLAYKERGEEILPRILPANLHNLEYEIMSKVYRMTLDKKPVVALVAPYSDKTVNPQMLALLRQMGQVPAQYREDKFRILESALRYEAYDLARIRLTEQEPLPDDLDTLIIISPENFNDRQRYEISRFLHEGGNVILAAQKYEYDYQQARNGVSISPRQKQSGLNPLLKDYGVSISESLLMDERHEVLSIAGGGVFGPFAVSIPVKAPMHIMVNQETMNQEMSITGRLSSLFYLWGSALDLDEEKLTRLNLKKNILMTTSDKSWTVPFRGGALNRNDVTHTGSSYEGTKPLAVLFEGQFPHHFEEKDVPSWPEEKSPDAPPASPPPPEKETAKSLQAQPGKLFVIGCSKMFEEEFVKVGGAINLFVNAVDAVTLGGELINIRSHQPINRATKTLKRIEKVWYRFLTILLVPLIVIVLGSIRAVMRRKEKEQYLRLLPAKTE